MNRLIILLMCLLICITLIGCSHSKKTVNKSKTTVKSNLPVITLSGDVIASSISPDMKFLALITQNKQINKELLLISLESRKLLKRIEIEGYTVEWSEDSKRLICSLSYSPGEVIVLSADGVVVSTLPVSACKFKYMDSNKLIYMSENSNQTALCELDIESNKSRVIRTINGEIDSLSVYDGRDCYLTESTDSDTTNAIDIYTGKKLFSLPIDAISHDSIVISFSPDAKYTAVSWVASGCSYFIIGHTEDAKKLMSHRYLGSYSRSSCGAMYEAKWHPFNMKQNGYDMAIVDTDGASSIVNLTTGEIDLYDYPACIEWYRYAGNDNDLLVIDKKGIRTDMCQGSNILKFDTPREQNDTKYMINFEYLKKR